MMRDDEGPGPLTHESAARAPKIRQRLTVAALISHLELAKRPDLYGGPVVVGEWEEHVIAASEEALPFGVLPGMPLRQAEHLCPHATFITPDPDAAARLRELIASALYDLAPVVEVKIEGIAWLDVFGVVSPGESIRETRRRLRTAIGREPRLGLAPGPFSARVAATHARPGRLLQVEDARAFLAPLPSRELALDEEQLERLDLLGLRTLGAVAAIGPRELESQLGREGRHAVLLARGAEPDELTPWRPPQFTSAHRQFEPPVEDREALLFVSRALCGDLAEELGLRGAGAKRVRARLVYESGDPDERASIVRHRAFTGTSWRWRRAQAAPPPPHLPTPHAAVRLGVVMTRLLSPAAAVELTLAADGSPAFISGALSGPIDPIARWKVETEWWNRLVVREYWKVLVGSNLLCELYHDLDRDAWFVERVYD